MKSAYLLSTIVAMALSPMVSAAPPELSAAMPPPVVTLEASPVKDAAASASASDTATATGEPSMFAGVNDATKTGAVDGKGHAAALLRAQVLLDRAQFSPGEIDAGYGSNTTKAIAAFQQAHGIGASGHMDAPTWAALNAQGAPALVQYTVTAADVAGPYAPIPADMLAKSKLKHLGYASAAEALGEQFHASPTLLGKLNPGKDLSRAGNVLWVPNVTVPAPAKAAKVVVDKSDSSVMLVDAAGKIYARYPASTGSSHDPLPIGDWTIKGVATNPTFQYNPALFWDADPSHSKAKIPAGPNNPVGVVWVDLSKEHYGIHGTPSPSKIGKTESHGCIRLTNWTAQALAQAVSPGMTAVLQE